MQVDVHDASGFFSFARRFDMQVLALLLTSRDWGSSCFGGFLHACMFAAFSGTYLGGKEEATRLAGGVVNFTYRSIPFLMSLCSTEL
jgi:hypothetical protein